MSTLNEKELVNRAASGDKEAFRQLFETYYTKVYNAAFQVVRNSADAEEIVQESFVKAYLALPGFKGDSSFYTWLYRIVRNMSIDVKRKLSRRFQAAPGEIDFERQSDQPELGTRPAKPDEAFETKEGLTQIQRALSNISGEHKEILTLREIEGLSYEEIAEITGLNSGTVMSRLFYARKALQAALAEVQDQVIKDRRQVVANPVKA